MDPQKLSQLDPKLRDAYQRVMGTPLPQVQPASPRGEPIQAQAPPPPAGGPTPPMPDPTPTPTPSPEPPAPIPTPHIQEPPTAPPPTIQPPTPEPSIPTPQPAIPTPPARNNFVQMHSEVPSSSANFSAPMSMPQGQTLAIKHKNGMMPILIGLASVIFLAVYTLFWTKVFNFKVPFLP